MYSSGKASAFLNEKREVVSLPLLLYHLFKNILNNLAVYCAVVHALEEVVQVLELAALVALVYDACYSSVAHTLNTSQSEADVALLIC